LDSKFVNSPKQVAELLYNELKIPQRQGTGEDILISLLGNVVKDSRKRQIIEQILELRGDTKTSGTYINARPDYDGRMRTSYRIVGTETGRSSTSILKPPVRPEKIGLAFQTLTKHGEGSQIRKMFIPDDGYVIMEWDLSQAEARISSLLANDEETLRLFDSVDIHAYTAGLIFGGDWRRFCKNEDGSEPVERYIGKTVRHACNYGMQKRMLMQVINTGAKNAGIDLTLSEWKAGKILEAFHSAFPKIEQIFQRDVAEELDRTSTLVNPYGRIRQFFGEPQSKDTYGEGYAFIPQSTVADHLKFAALRILERKPDFRIVMEVHDAIVAFVKIGEENLVDSIVREELEQPIDFKNCSLSRGILVIPTECQIGVNNLKEMKKFKNAA
jgi:DNA polymerase-1